MEIPTVKIADADCPNGFRIINVADRKEGDKEYVEKPAKAESAKPVKKD